MNRPTHTRTFQRLVEGTTINSKTLLATDYLNHFNEMVMSLDMLLDMPEMMEEARTWKPKSYETHFKDSVFPEKDLAVWAFEQAPLAFRKPFDKLIAAMNDQVALRQRQIEEGIEKGEEELLRVVAGLASSELQAMISKASAIIHGNISTEENKADEEVPGSETMIQADIDSLFD